MQIKSARVKDSVFVGQMAGKVKLNLGDDGVTSMQALDGFGLLVAMKDTDPMLVPFENITVMSVHESEWKAKPEKEPKRGPGRPRKK